MAFFKRTPREETVRKVIHDQAMEDWRVAYQGQFNEAARLRGELETERQIVRTLQFRNRELNSELAALRAEQERRKAQARANLKQFKAKQAA